MNLDQLDAALEQATGVAWTERRGGVDVRVLTLLAGTLGKPDYIQNTVEDLTPSALFQKFLDDAARTTCEARVRLDLAGGAEAGEWGPLWGALSLREPPSEEALSAQLRALALRFHGQALPDGDSAALAYWRWLYETARLVGGGPEVAWRALCVGLITHPDFYSY